MHLELEILFTEIIDSTVCYLKNTIDITETEKDPDDIVLKRLENILNETPTILKENFIIHSTSWRYESEGKIALTYLVYSDHFNFEQNKTKKLSFNELKLAVSSSHKKPRPVNINEVNIISHAIRHLAFLVENCDHDNYKRCLTTETFKRLKDLKAIPAGEI